METRDQSTVPPILRMLPFCPHSSCKLCMSCPQEHKQAASGQGLKKHSYSPNLPRSCWNVPVKTLSNSHARLQGSQPFPWFYQAGNSSYCFHLLKVPTVSLSLRTLGNCPKSRQGRPQGPKRGSALPGDTQLAKACLTLMRCLCSLVPIRTASILQAPPEIQRCQDAQQYSFPSPLTSLVQGPGRVHEDRHRAVQLTHWLCDPKKWTNLTEPGIPQLSHYP